MNRANARNAPEGSIMRMHALVSAGFAAAALAGASLPASAWTVWPDVDFEWYTDVGAGRNMPDATVEVMPAPRLGYIWAPARWEAQGTGQRRVAGHWIKDDYADQVLVYNNLNGTTSYAAGPMILRDSQGEIILPPDPSNYPVSFGR
jgi:hypothetical protein